ncbi:MAG: TlpA family protein disulfide reductase [Ignavibacteria bacterium]|nr:TlpA family protein disulfide reductase [Ignavibacteria bacterium]
MNHRIFFLTYFSFLVFFVSGCNKNTADEREENKQQQSVSQETGTTTPVLGEYLFVQASNTDAAPNLHWKDAQGNSVTLSSFTEKLTLVNFWTTWCGPCKMETPDMVEVQNELRNKGVKFLGISADTGPSASEDVREFINHFKLSYPIIIDRDEEIQSAFGNVRAYPTTFLLNKDGKIVSQWIGARPKEFFLSEIEKFL